MDKDVVHVYSGAFLNHRKEWNNAICSNMDVPRVVILSEVNQRQISYITYVWNLKYDTNEPMYKIETHSQTLKTSLWLPKGKGEEDTLGVWD